MKLFYFVYRIGCKVKAFFRNKYVNSCCTSVLSSPPRILGDITINAKNVKFGSNVVIYPGVYIWGENIEIGNNVNIGVGTIIFSCKRVYIGDDTIIAGQCYIIDSNHSIDKNMVIQKQSLKTAVEGIFIGKDVWIGAQCFILKGAKINNGGADMESGNIIQRVKAFIPILIPLFVSAFRRAYELATAMECRCYRGGTGRTRMKTIHMAKRDYVSFVMVALLIGGVILCNIFLPAAV